LLVHPFESRFLHLLRSVIQRFCLRFVLLEVTCFWTINGHGIHNVFKFTVERFERQLKEINTHFIHMETNRSLSLFLFSPQYDCTIVTHAFIFEQRKPSKRCPVLPLSSFVPIQVTRSFASLSALPPGRRSSSPAASSELLIGFLKDKRNDWPDSLKL